MKLERLTFDEIYLIFVNDFLTIEKMAEYYQVPKTTKPDKRPLF